jgi:sugar/nucleoside kinase (ribokinase family)
MKPVLCLGDICADLIIPYADALKAKADPGAVLNADVRPAEGGSAANTACALARLGIPVLFCGTCGNDAYGQMLKSGLEREGVDTSLLRMDADKPTQLVLLVLNEQNDRTAFACPAHLGSQHAILPTQIPDDITERISWLHVNGMLLREDPAASTQLALMQRCRTAGVPVSFDINVRVEALQNPAFFRNVQLAMERADYILGSAIDEIPMLANERDAELSARKLAENGAAVIARSGAQGADLYRGDSRLHFPAFPVTVADTVGAGDTFDGAFIAAILSGKSDADALREANAAAAICVSRPSGRGSPTREALDAFLTERC